MKIILIIAFALISVNSYSQKIEGYIFDTKIRNIKSDDIQVEMQYDKREHNYYRVVLEYNASTFRVEIKNDDDYIPVSAPSITYMVSFLAYNGWEKTSINEDVDNNKVTIFCKKKTKK